MYENKKGTDAYDKVLALAESSSMFLEKRQMIDNYTMRYQLIRNQQE